MDLYFTKAHHSCTTSHSIPADDDSLLNTQSASMRASHPVTSIQSVFASRPIPSNQSSSFDQPVTSIQSTSTSQSVPSNQSNSAAQSNTSNQSTPSQPVSSLSDQSTAEWHTPVIGVNPHQSEKQFPRKKFGQQYRSFQASWFKNWTWLHYDETRDRVFCTVNINFQITSLKNLSYPVVFKSGKTQ